VAAQNGVVLLLLLLGLEYTPDELIENLKAHAVSGAVDLVANATPGVVLALVMGWGVEGAVALGGITYISSSGVIAKTLSDLGRLGNRETPAVLSVLVIEDLVMAAYLPVLTVLLVSGDDGGGSSSVVLALVAAVVILVVAVRGSATISRLVASRSDEVLLFGVLGLGLLVAGLAEQLSVSGAVGAFLVGIAVSGATATRAEPLLRPLRDLFAAAFFVFFALGVDIDTLGSTLPAAIGLAVVGAVTKVGTGWWAARRAGIAPAGRWRAGTVLVSRGEFSIVIAGLAAGVAPELAPLAAGYVLLTAVGGTVLTRLVDVAAERRRKRAGPVRATPGT
jgi:CPA2 family monovalent cation:H+ antiporter-2